MTKLQKSRIKSLNLEIKKLKTLILTLRREISNAAGLAEKIARLK